MYVNLINWHEFMSRVIKTDPLNKDHMGTKTKDFYD